MRAYTLDNLLTMLEAGRDNAFLRLRSWKRVWMTF
jgi:hypothetical protein